MSNRDLLYTLRDGLPHPLKVMRTAAGLTQDQLARRAEVTEAYVRRAEQGLMGRNADLSKLFRVCIEAAQSQDRMTIAFNRAKETYILAANEADSTKLLHVERPGNNSIGYFVSDYFDLLNLINGELFKGYELTPSYSSLAYFIDDMCLALGLDTSVYAFCRGLGLHLYPVQRWAKRWQGKRFDGAVAANWPLDLYQVMQSIGVDTTEVATGGRL